MNIIKVQTDFHVNIIKVQTDFHASYLKKIGTLMGDTCSFYLWDEVKSTTLSTVEPHN